MSRLSDAIQSARQQTVYTQAEIAAWIGTNSNNYNAMENGNRPISKATISRLSDLPMFPLSEEEMLFLKSLDQNPKLAATEASYIFARQMLAGKNKTSPPSLGEIAEYLRVSVEDVKEIGDVVRTEEMAENTYPLKTLTQLYENDREGFLDLLSEIVGMMSDEELARIIARPDRVAKTKARLLKMEAEENS